MISVLLIVAAVAVFWMIGAYNGLISLKNQTTNALKQIDVQLKRGHDLITSLIAAVQGAMDFGYGSSFTEASARTTSKRSAAAARRRPRSRASGDAFATSDATRSSKSFFRDPSTTVVPSCRPRT